MLRWIVTVSLRPVRGKGQNWHFPPEPLGMSLNFQWRRFKNPNLNLTLNVAAHPLFHETYLAQLKASMAWCYTQSSKPRSGFCSLGSSLTFPASEPQFHVLYVTCLFALGEEKILKKPQQQSKRQQCSPSNIPRRARKQTIKPSSTHILSPLGLTAFSRSFLCLCFGVFISIFITLACAAWEAGDLSSVLEVFT